MVCPGGNSNGFHCAPYRDCGGSGNARYGRVQQQGRAGVGRNHGRCGKRPSLAQSSRAALEQFYATRPGARKLGEGAKAILVFPSITKAGLGIGGLYGDGTMFEGGKPVGYYNIAGGTFGLQIGAQSFSQAYFFNTAEALKTFRETKGFQARRRRQRSRRRLRRQRRDLDHRPCRSRWWWPPGASPGLMAGIDVKVPRSPRSIPRGDGGRGLRSASRQPAFAVLPAPPPIEHSGEASPLPMEPAPPAPVKSHRSVRGGC